jgi:hypothetical protein
MGWERVDAQEIEMLELGRWHLARVCFSLLRSPETGSSQEALELLYQNCLRLLLAATNMGGVWAFPYLFAAQVPARSSVGQALAAAIPGSYKSLSASRTGHRWDASGRTSACGCGIAHRIIDRSRSFHSGFHRLRVALGAAPPPWYFCIFDRTRMDDV